VADSYHEEVLDAATTMATAAALSGVGTKVYRRLTGDRAAVTMPCLIVNLEGCKEEWRPLDTEYDVLTLPVNIALAHHADMRATDPMLARWLLWRQNLRVAFLMQLMDDVSEVWHVEVRPLDTLDSQRVIGPEFQGFASAVMLLPEVVVPRVRP
jgi:hypothetical protein